MIFNDDDDDDDDNYVNDSEDYSGYNDNDDDSKDGDVKHYDVNTY